jgi:carboxyl-terminal processing protease
MLLHGMKPYFRKILLFSLLLMAANAVLAQPSAIAKRYMDEVCRIIEKQYIFIDSIDLPAACKQVMPMMDTAKTTKNTYPAIEELLRIIGADHMHILPPDISKRIQFDTTRVVYPSARLLDDSIGYIKVPHFLSPEQLKTPWADTIIAQLYALDKHSLKGWIIDLRGNWGGAQHPMIGGLAPLIPDGLLWSNYGRREKPSGSDWIRGGYFFERNEKGGGWSFPTSYQNDLRQKYLPVAVLMDSSTGSSGERAAIALLTNPNARSFGGLSGGLLTGNTNTILSDGAMLIITIAVMKDRNGHVFPDRLVPDFPVQPEPGKDIVMDAARKWLNSH